MPEESDKLAYTKEMKIAEKTLADKIGQVKQIENTPYEMEIKLTEPELSCLVAKNVERFMPKIIKDMRVSLNEDGAKVTAFARFKGAMVPVDYIGNLKVSEDGSVKFLLKDMKIANVPVSQKLLDKYQKETENFKIDPATFGPQVKLQSIEEEEGRL